LTGSSTSPTGGGINELCPLLESLVRPVRRPEGYEERDALVSAARNLVQAFRERSRELTGVREDAPEMLAPDIRDLNGYLSEMAALNDKIVEADITGGTASDLRDKRSALLKTISGLIELDYYEASDGSLSGFLSAGHSLVQGGTFHALDVAVNPSNGNYYDFVLRVRSRGKRRQRPDQSGEIAGLSALGTIHPRVSERPGRTRRNLVSAVNSRHGQGFDLKGIRGKLFRRRSERGPWK
jgi:flagellar hook-associated protein 1 FlgK